MTNEIIDTKVVQMIFDNNDFEKNVDTSLRTLEKLKASLDLTNSASGLDNIANAAKRFSVTSLTSAVETVSSKFSAMEVIGITALANITNSAVNAGKNLVKSMSLDQVAEGWKKFGDKTQSVGTLLAQGYDLDTVNEQLDRLNWFTDETSYNFVDMVENISKFTAAGQDLDTSVTAMEGIANWAALSGQNAATASRAMYQLSQAMGKGVLKNEDFKSIQNASMDTKEFRQHCLDAAVALGTLKKTGVDSYAAIGHAKHEFDINSFTEYLSKDAWLTSDVMMQVFHDYSSAVDDIYEYTQSTGMLASEAIAELGGSLDEFGVKAFKAAQEARTFEDVVNSVKDAVSTSLMNTFEIVFGDYEEATKLWTAMANSLYDVFAEPINQFNNFLEGAFSVPGRVLNAKDLFNLDLNETQMSAFQKLLTETARKHNVAIDQMIEKEGSFNATIKNGWLTGEIFDDAIKSISTLSTKSIGDLEKIREAAVAVIKGDYSTTMSKRFEELAANGYDPERVQKYVNVLHKLTNGTWEFSDAVFEAADAQMGSVESLAAMSDAELETIGYTQEEISVLRDLKEQAKETGTPINELYDSLLRDMARPTGRQHLLNAVTNALTGMATVGKIAKETWAEIIPPATSKGLYGFLEKLDTLSKKLIPTKEATNKLRKAFSGLFSLFDMGGQIVGSFTDAFGPIVSGMLGDFLNGALDVSAGIGEWLSKLSKWLETNKVFSTAFEAAASRFQKYRESVKSAGLAIESWVTRNIIANGTLEKVKDTLLNGVNAVLNWGAGTSKFASNLKIFQKVSDVAYKAFDKLRGLFFYQKVDENGSFVATGWSAFLYNMTDSLGKFSKPISNVITGFRTWMTENQIVEKGIGRVTKIISDADEAISNWYENFKNNPLVKSFAEEATKRLNDFRENVKSLFRSGPDDTDDSDWFDNFLTNMSAKLEEAKINVQEWFNSLLEIPVVKQAWDTVSDFVSKTLTRLKGYFGDAEDDTEGFFGFLSNLSWDKLKTGFQKMFADIQAYISGGGLFSDAKKTIESFTKSLGEFDFGALVNEAISNFLTFSTNGLIGLIDPILAALGGYKDQIAEFLAHYGIDLDALLEQISSFVSGVPEAFKNADWKAVGIVIRSIAALMAVRKIGKVAKSIKLFSTTIGTVGKSLVGSVGDVLKGGIDGIVTAFNAIKTSIESLGKVADAIASEKKAAAFKDRAKGLALIAGSLVVLVGAAVALSYLSDERLKRSGIILGVLALALLAFVGVAKVLDENAKEMVKAAGAMLGMVSAVLLLVVALKMLESLNTSLDSGIVSRMAVLGAIVTGLTAVAYVLGKGEGASVKGAGAFIAMALSVLILVRALKKIEKLNPETLVKTLGVLGLVMTGLTLMLKTTSGGEWKGGLGILAMAIAMQRLVSVMKAIGEMDTSAAIAGIGGLLLLVVDIRLLLSGLNKAGANAAKAGVGVLLIAVAMKSLMSTIKMIGKMPIKTAIQGFVGVSALLLELSLLMKRLTDAGNNAVKAGVSILLISGALVLLRGTIKYLGELPLDTLVQGEAAILAFLVVVGLLMKFSQQAAGAKSFLGATAAFVISLIALVGAIAVLTNLDVDSVWSTAKSLTLVMLAFAAMSYALGQIDKMGPVIVGALAGLLEFAGIAAVFYLLKDVDGENMYAQSKALLLAIGGLALVCTGMSKLGVNLPAATQAALGLAAFLGIIAGAGLVVALVTWVIDSIYKALTGDEVNSGQAILDGLDLLVKIAGKIGEFVGALVGGFMNGMALFLPSVGNSLSGFFTNAKVFFDGVTDLDDNVVNKVGTLSESVNKLANAEFTDAITQFLTASADLDSFSNRIVVMGQAIKDYCDMITNAEVDPEKISKAQDIADFFAKLDGINIPFSGGGILNWFRKTGELGKFAISISTMGLAIKNYNKAISGISSDDLDVELAERIATFLANLGGENIPVDGGIITYITGQNNLAAFGNKLPTFGQGLNKYAQEIAKITVDDTTVEKAERIGKFLAALSKEIPAEGGWAQIVDGYKDLGSFGMKLVPFGLGLRIYANAIKGIQIDAEVQQKTEELATWLADFANHEAPKDKGIVQWILGGASGDLKKFGEQLKPFGEGITEYCNALGDSVTSDKVKVANDAVEILASFSKIADSQLNADFNEYGAYLNTFGQNLAGFDNKTKSINVFHLMAVGAAIKTLSKQLSDVANVDNDKISSLSSSLKTMSGDVVSRFDSFFNDAAGQMPESVKSFLNAFNSGISSDDTAVGEISAFGDRIVEALLGKEEDFKDAGITLLQYVGLGFADETGLSTATVLAEAASKSIAEAMIGAEQRDTMRGVAKVLMDNFSIGLSNMTEEKGFVTSVTGAIDSIRTAIDKKIAVFKARGEKVSKGLSDGMKNGANAFKNIYSEPLGSALSSVIKYVQQFYNQGTNISTALKNGLSTANAVISTAFNIPLNSAVDSVRSLYGSFSSAGAYLVQGFAGGITLHTYVARQAAAAMANAAKDSANKTLGVSSPSKVFYQIGSYTGQGFVNALYDYGSNAYVAGADIADNARRGLSGAIGKVSDVIENGMDSEPTIRPVLDLSNVQEGMDVISGMFSGGTQLSMMANARAISSGMAGGASGNQNEVISAIDRLGTQLATASGPSYTINGITYENGSTVANAIETLVQAVIVNKRS